MRVSFLSTSSVPTRATTSKDTSSVRTLGVLSPSTLSVEPVWQDEPPQAQNVLHRQPASSDRLILAESSPFYSLRHATVGSTPEPHLRPIPVLSYTSLPSLFPHSHPR